MNTFTKFPDFILSDPRTKRKSNYKITTDLISARTQALLPEDLLKGNTVLDIGCCTGYMGAWALDHGAKHYTGIDVQKKFTDIATDNFKKCFPDQDWKILSTSFEDFLKENDQKYDVVIASSVMHASPQYQQFIKNICSLATVAVVVESKTPSVLLNCADHKDTDFENISVTEYCAGNMIYDDVDNLVVPTAYPSLGVLIKLFSDEGYTYISKSYQNLKDLHNLYKNNQRYGAVFKKTGDQTETTVDSYYKNKTFMKRFAWREVDKPLSTDWKFDESVAASFANHARQHIPDYDKVIDLSVSLCEQLLSDPVEDKIIDVGCATGETVNRLWDNKLCNLIGVDNSQPMLDRCQNKNVFYINSNRFPHENGPYKAVLCNWTLHFIKNKIDYLEDIFNGLDKSGFLILSEKTCNTGIELELYHNFKRKNGVSDSEIERKSEQLKNVMFVDDVDWYIQAFKNIGFQKWSIINAAPCFTTFLAFK
jgi:tRNA (cmo5U34)-methyltransferase